MFKFKINERVVYDDNPYKIINRFYKEYSLIDGGTDIKISYDLETINGGYFELNVKESELKQYPKYTITIEDNLGDKRTYHAKEILDASLSTMTFAPSKTMINDVEVDSIIGIKFQ